MFEKLLELIARLNVWYNNLDEIGQMMLMTVIAFVVWILIPPYAVVIMFSLIVIRIIYELN